MKVVLFCGGFGMRIKEFSEAIPKPLVNIGYRPILWHVMKYYAHYGHKDFILCLGYKADAIKQYFLNYNECLTNDFVLADGGKQVTLLNSDIHDWRITFVDTGITSNVGQRLKLVEPYLKNEEMFLANYTDGLSDLPLPDYIEHFQRRNKLAGFVCVKPSQSFHVVTMEDGDLVSDIHYESYKDFNGVNFPSIIEIWRPQEEYDITLSIVKLQLNEPLPNDKFTLEQPPGAQVVRLDQPPTKAPPGGDGK